MRRTSSGTNILWISFFLFLPFLSLRLSILSINLSISMIVMVLIFLVIILKSNFNIGLPRSYIFSFAILFIGWSVIGSLYTNNFELALKKNIELIFGIVVLITTFNYFKYNKIINLKKYFVLLIVSNSIFLTFLLYKYLFIFNVDYLGLNHKFATEAGKNSLAFYLAFITPISIAFLIEKTETIIKKVILFPSILINFLALFFVSSRAAWLSIIITLLLNILLLGKKGFRIFIFIFSIAVAFLIFSPEYQKERFYTLFNLSESAVGSSQDLRQSLISFSLQVFGEKPIIGWGTGSFTNISENRGLGGLTSHNDFALIAVENGIIGLIIISLFLGSAFYLSFITIKRYETNWEIRGILNSAMTLIIYLFFINALDSIFLWLSLGLVLSITSVHKYRKFDYKKEDEL